MADTLETLVIAVVAVIALDLLLGLGITESIISWITDQILGAMWDSLTPW